MAIETLAISAAVQSAAGASLEFNQWQWGYIVGFPIGFLCGVLIAVNWCTWSAQRAAAKEGAQHAS